MKRVSTTKQAMRQCGPFSRTFLALFVLYLAAAPAAQSVGQPQQAAGAAQVYRDLPGVKPQSGDLFGPAAYQCETIVRYVKQRQGVHFFGDGVPVRVYRCTRNGVVYESLDPPNPSGGWYPGVNPRIIDR
ncbi:MULTISPECIES: hypothetical protein [Alphaproteobacteria]|uniref:Secreted protein n=2 Tax=Alphaproteobacteria TaxID=28211 RepID=A0A512HP26_9HYPH|nr:MULTISPECIES: hypothetical protein [Alphaproteobacteria]GEO87202.1 hypothetical protein RNA01_41340 [Ciceribacter naphthalenivorans]GLR23068.1 hypothetical protein GCM10007920_28560 [Ciceribacter naphthalenivorans]GLT05924.1 hypothetical protein GCM10007926_28560 [Sphingomonas psychrolutea]